MSSEEPENYACSVTMPTGHETSNMEEYPLTQGLSYYAIIPSTPSEKGIKKMHYDGLNM